jgi:hypothetical protein
MQTMWENFMKLINSESPVFMNVRINPIFQILGGDIQASRSHFIVHTGHSPLKKMISSPCISVSWQWISDGQTFLVFKNQINEQTSELAGYVIYVVLYKAL